EALAPAGGIGTILQWERQGGEVVAFTRSGPWRWREGAAGFEKMRHDGASELTVLGLARHPDGRVWALASMSELAGSRSEGARLLHGVWPVRLEDGGREIRGLNRTPVAVVDRIGVYSTAFFEPSLPD